MTPETALETPEVTQIKLTDETHRTLREAYEIAVDAERQLKMAQLNVEAKVARWQLALVTAQRELNVPSGWPLNFETRQFEAPEKPTIQ